MKLFFTCILFILNLSIQLTLANDCVPTPNRTTGTHYQPVTVEKVNLGKGVIVKGQILNADDCMPIANAKIARWQGGESGRYEDRFYAYMFADENGQYEFETEWPNMPSPHIHFIVTADGFETVETQWIGNERQTAIEFDIVLEKNK